MPDLDFAITAVEPAERALTPLLHFRLRVTCHPASETVYGATLNAQIQIQAPRRQYSADEKAKLVEVFGTPDRWGETLRNRFWTNTQATVNAFTGSAELILPVACTFDLNILATKYFYALNDDEVPLLFLFSGSVFYAGEKGQLQVQRISWEKECTYRMPVRLWQQLMEHHYPNCAWINLRRDVFDQLCAYKRRHGIPSWEQTLERLLPALDSEEVLA
jgi:hypothetical protein